MRTDLKQSVLLLVVIFCVDCQSAKQDPGPASPAVPTTPEASFVKYYDLTSLPVSTSFDSPTLVCAVNDAALNEISGIAASYAQGSSVWTEEDSGNENKLYLIGNNGSTIATMRMVSVNNRDWEDMSLSNGPLLNVHYLYLADIGDNKFSQPTKYIYRFPEPSLANVSLPFTGEIAQVEKMEFNYPDGIKNSEAVMVDPVTLDIYVISKEGQAVVYVARYPQDISKTFTMRKLGTLPISDVTAADISPDGKEILLKNYAVVLYWKKANNESITDLLQQIPQRAPYVPEPKGESICWATDGSGYFTTSEIIDSTPANIYFYKRK